MIILTGVLIACILLAIYENNLNILISGNPTSFLIVSAIIVSFFIYISLSTISHIIKRHYFYHDPQNAALWASLIVTFIIYCYFFIFLPQFSYVPALLITLNSFQEKIGLDFTMGKKRNQNYS